MINIIKIKQIINILKYNYSFSSELFVLINNIHPCFSLPLKMLCKTKHHLCFVIPNLIGNPGKTSFYGFLLHLLGEGKDRTLQTELSHSCTDELAD